MVEKRSLPAAASLTFRHLEPFMSGLTSRGSIPYSMQQAEGNNVTDGGNILRAEDLSGNDYHYGSNTIATAPTWKESAINGIGAANCDGVDDHLNIGEPPNLAGDFTMLAVFQRATDGIYSSITGQASYVYAWPTDNNLYWGRWGGSPSTGPNLTGTYGRLYRHHHT